MSDEESTDAKRGQVSTSAAEVYEEFFLPALFAQWPDRLLDRAGVGSGDAVLDVGCGTGILARTAYERVQPGGAVTGVDPNSGMLGVARRTTGIDWVQGSAENLGFADDWFDAVVSQFAMMFFDDRPQAVGELRRVLRPGGVAAIATWADLDSTPGYAAAVDLLDSVLGIEAGNALRVPFNMGLPAILEDLLSAHFDEVSVEVVEGRARFDSIDAWVHTDIRGWTQSDVSDDEYERLIAAARIELAAFVQEDGVVSFPAPALIAVSC